MTRKLLRDYLPTLYRFLGRFPHTPANSPDPAGTSAAGGWRIRPWWLYQGPEIPRHALLGLLATMHGERLEYTPLIAAFAQDHRGWYRRRLQKLAQRLDAGTPLVDALEQTSGVLNHRELLTLRIAAQNGTLNAAIKEISSLKATPSQTTRLRFGQAVGYLVIMLVVTSLILFFLIFSLNPMFEELAKGLEKPQAIAALIQVPWFQYLPLVFAILAGVIVFSIFLRNRFGWTLFRGTPLQCLARHARHAEIDHMLARALDAGRPLQGTIASLARYHDDPQIRRKLLLARNEIELGVPLWESLQQTKIIPANLAMTLAQTDSPAVQSWILEQYSQSQSRSLERRLRIAVIFLQPLFVMLLGLVVGWIVSSYFSFLTQFTQEAL